MKPIVSRQFQYRIYFIRNQFVMTDIDLSKIYAIKLSNLKNAVSWNMTKLYEDFLFQLTAEEIQIFNLRSAIEENHSCVRYAFTGRGIAVIATLLASDRNSQTPHSPIRLKTYQPTQK